MKIKSVQTGGQWLELIAKPAHEAPDPATADVARALSAAVRSQNLVILTGLGTSLCVTKDGKSIAPTMGDLLEKIKKLFSMSDALSREETGSRWARFENLANTPAECEDLELIMSRATIAADFLKGSEASSIQKDLEAAETIIRDEVDFMNDDVELPVHEAFLRRVGRRSARRARTKIFTTNYDLCFEIAARRSGFVVVDGFAFGSESLFDSAQFSYDVVRRASGEEKSDFIENLFHLHKLHGSIDWELNPSTSQIAKKPGTSKPLLIYPRSTKYEMAFSQPYIEMMGTFQAGVRATNTALLVIGFGFNDKHIAEPILAAIKGNLSLNVVVVNPDVEEKSGDGKNSYLNSISSLIDDGDARLSLIAGKFEEIVRHIHDVMAETELEKHTQRVRNLGRSHD